MQENETLEDNSDLEKELEQEQVILGDMQK